MEDSPPKTVALDYHDDWADYVGRTKDGRQFFLTTPFVPADRVGTETGREFLALYIFDAAGNLETATIDDLGTRASMDEEARDARTKELLASLGDVTYERITVVPFKVERFGVEFGFIAWPPDPEDGEDGRWCVTVEPGDYMCFWHPWTTGDYDT